MNRLGPETWLPVERNPDGDRRSGDPWSNLLFVVFKWLPEMAAIVVIGVMLGLGYMLFLRGDVYQANAKLYVRVGVDQTPSPLIGADRNVTFLAQTRGAVQSEMDLLRNELLVKRLIADLDLTAPEARPRPSGFFGQAKDIASQAYHAARDAFDRVLISIGLKVPLSPEAAITQVFSRSLILDNATGSDVISVSLRWPNQAQAIVLLDRYLHIYTNFRSEMFQSRGDIDFLATKRDNAKAALESLETEIATFDREHDIRNASSRAPLLEAELVEAQRSEERQALELGLARRRLERLDKGLHKGASGQQEPIGLGTFPANSPALGMAASIVTLMGERERLLVNNSAGAPEVKEVEAKLDALMKVLRQQLDAEVQELVRGEAAARARVDKASTSLRDLQAASNGSKSLERRHQLADAIYRDTEKRLSEARDISALRNARLSNVVVVQPAAVEGVPVGLRKMPMLGIIAGCAVVLAAGWALAREIFDTRLYRGAQAAAALGLPLCGTVPECRGLLSRWLNGGRADASRLALDKLVVTVDESLKAAHSTMAAIVGAAAGEGVSTLSLVLAYGIAGRRKQRVLLVADPDDPDVLQRAQSLGADVKPLPRSSDLPPGLDLTAVGEHLVCGTWADREAAAAVLRPNDDADIRLRGDAVLTLLDLPPLFSTPEAPFVAGRAAATLLIAAAGHHRAVVYNDALDALSKHGAKPIGVVLNRFRRFVPRFLEPEML